MEEHNLKPDAIIWSEDGMKLQIGDIYVQLGRNAVCRRSLPCVDMTDERSDRFRSGRSNRRSAAL